MEARTLARIVHMLGGLKKFSTRGAWSRRNYFAKLARFGAVFAIAALVMQTLFTAAPSTESIATFASDCSTPQTIFVLGDTVCAKASGSPLGPPAQRRIEWVAPDGSVFQLGPFLTADPQSDSITIPANAPVGTWQAKIVDRSNSGFASAKFTVRDSNPDNTNVDLWCPISAPFQVSPGSAAPFTVFVTNKGPNDATNVTLTVTVATNSTFQSETQGPGPTFNCTAPEGGISTCTIETLPAGTTSQLTFVYDVDSEAQPGSTVSSTSHVVSDTPELFATDNTFTASVSISPATCDVTCPSDITDVKDASQCGKVVEYANASGTGSGCGTVICSPAAGSVFPIGATNVVCSGDNGGPCVFRVTIHDTGTTISCPANKNVSEGSPGIGSAVVSYAAPTFPDSCSVLDAACNPPSGSSFPVGTTTVDCASTGSSGAVSCSFTVTVNSLVCVLICPDDAFAIESPAGSGSATVTFPLPAPSGCPAVTRTCSPTSGSVFPVGTTTVNCIAKDGSNNTVATCTLAVTVSPAALCTLTCPDNVAVTEDGNPNPDPGAVVTYTLPTTQNCSGVTVTCSPASQTRFPLGTTSVTCVARDTSDNEKARCGFVVIVNTLSGVTLTFNNDPGQCGRRVNYTVPTNNCSGTLTCTPPPLDPDEPGMATFFPVGVTVVNCVNNAASPCSFNFNVAVLNTNPTPAITSPASGALYTVGSTVSFSGSFTDDVGTPHSALWTFVSGSLTASEDGAVTETTGTTGTVTASHTFNAIGVYLVTLSVSDRCGGTGTTNTVSPSALTAMVVIYDPNGGFVTGGGWIDSPAGAYVANTSLAGRLSLGINAKYQNNSTIPTGQTEVQFREANFNFHSTSYDWLIITGAKAQYSGSGTVNGAGNYGFLVTVIDGNVSGGGGVDKFRIKIWDKNNNNAVVYDNQMGASDNANPTTSLGGGSIVVH